MRGRTNITQRTGPSVIGNLVTQKQVTGSKIEVGDFVEFTGDTSAWESLAGPFNYTYSGKFNVNSNYNGIFYINPYSSQCRCIVFDKNGVVKITNLVNVAFDNKPISRIDYDSVNDKLYVLVTTSLKIYEFDFLNNTISYVRTINVSISSTYGTANLLCVRDGYIYCWSIVTSSSTNSTLYISKINLDGSTIVNVYQVEGYNYSGKKVFVTKNYVFFIGYSTSPNTQAIFKFSSGELKLQIHIDEGFLSRIFSASLIEMNDYFFMTGWQYAKTSSGSRTNQACSGVFYLGDDLDINVVDFVVLDVYPNTYNMNDFEMLVEKVEDDYRIIAAYPGRNYYNNVFYGDHYYLFLLNFSPFDSEIKLLHNIYLIDSIERIRNSELLSLVNYNDVYNLQYTKSDDDSSIDNYLCRTKFVVNDDSIMQTESLDLVKKYSSHINGVAKTEGNVGQTISVYIP